jgi:hypothetical protein
MKRFLLTALMVSPLVSYALGAEEPFVNTHSLQIISENDIEKRGMIPREFKQEVLNFHKEMKEKGYHEINNRYAQFLLNLKLTAQDEIRSYRGTTDVGDSHLKQSANEVPLAFDFKKLPINEKNIIGYAPTGSYVKSPKEGWNGIVSFFEDTNLGTCSYNFTDLNLSNGSITLTKEYTKYLVNNKPTYVGVEGNDQSGFVYTITWYNSLKVSTLNCATLKYDKNMSNNLIDLAKKIDK